MALSVMSDLIAPFHEKRTHPRLGSQLQHHRQFPPFALTYFVDDQATRFWLYRLTDLVDIVFLFAID